MQLTFRKDVAEQIGVKKLVPFGIPVERWKTLYGTTSSISIDIAGLSKVELARLRGVLEAAETDGARGAKTLLRDLALWERALTDSGGQKARTERQFVALLARYVQTSADGHRVYSQDDDGSWLPYYVESVDLRTSHDRDSKRQWCQVDLAYETFGRVLGKTITFHLSDFGGMTVREALARKGYVCETPDLRAQHQDDLAAFNALAPQVGLQCWAIGTATDDCDGNPSGRRNSWYWSRTNVVALSRDGEPSRVVVDIFYESPESDHGREPDIDRYFWKTLGRKAAVDDDAYDDDEIAAIDDDETATPEIPVHPILAVFDLARHLRVRVHVRQLSPYEYDAEIAEKLVIPDDRKRLIRMLVETRGRAFTDIVRGKSGGAVVLLAGPPGVGKTLTAEVYAEAERKALYSVQCSQLGIDPEAIEDELLKVFARAKRWRAVLLLDEADVYVHERGNDLAQNAIVGVFLRVLEYQSTVLFLTTNRPDDVDDAIASRCVARLTYAAPTIGELRRIWTVLADGAGIALAPGALDAIVADTDGISGRDVKNLLKLARVVAPDAPVTREAVAFARRFKPTTETVARRDMAALGLEPA